MELTVAQFEQQLIPTYRALGAVYRVLGDFREGTLDDALGELNIERQELERLSRRYLKLPDADASFADLLVLAFLVSRCRRAGVNRAQFEAAVAQELDSAPILFAPFWVPAVWAMGHPGPFFPVVAPRRSTVVRAYEGLARHLRALPSADALPEVSATAILWRVAALVDGLEPGDANLYDKMNAVRARVVQDTQVSEPEKLLWKPLTKRFSARRHALTHLIVRDGHTFESAAEYAVTSLDELISASAALGLAVLREIADDMAHMEPPVQAFERIWSEGVWIDDQM